MMKFKDGKFKILIISDFHSPKVIPEEMKNFTEKALAQTEPDLVVLLGDNTAGNFVGANSFTIEEAADSIVSLLDGVPFAVVLGNHDHEGLCNKQNQLGEKTAKEKIFSFYTKHENCLAKVNAIGERIGNYNLTIKDSKGEKDIFNLWFLDSGAYDGEGGYAFVEKEQTEFYEKISDELTEKNGGQVLPSMLFQHIIVPEIYECFDEKSSYSKGYTKGQCSYSDKFYKFKEGVLLSGKLNEGPCPPDVNAGQFDSWLKKGDIIAAFFGHDHVNDFVCEHKGIKLINVPSPSTYTYGNNRGVRTVTLYEDDLLNFDTQVIYYEDLCKEKIKNPVIRKYGIERYDYAIKPVLKLTAVTTAAVVLKALKHLRKNR